MDTSANEKYVPGVCNIGAAETRRRFWLMTGSFVLTVFVFTILLLYPEYRNWSWLMFVAGAALAVNFQQWYFRFCIRMAFAGLCNFDSVGKTTPVPLKGSRKKDRWKALQIVLSASIFGMLMLSVVYMFQ